MKKRLAMLLSLTILGALLCPVALAATDRPDTRVWGQVSAWEGEGLFLKNDNEEDPFREIVLHLGEAPVVDAATGLPLDMETLKEGDTLYAWIGPAVTMSLPPQAAALAVVGNVPADAAAPEFCQVSGAAVVPAPGGDGSARIPLLGGEMLEVNGETVYTPWLTRQVVRMEDLVPGARAMVWKDAEGMAEKVLLFPYAYQTYIAWEKDGSASVSGQALTASGRTVKQAETGEDVVLLPIRAVAEAAGCEVRWDKDLGAVVSRGGETVFSVRPGSTEVRTAGEDTWESGVPCLFEDGVTYLPAWELAELLNLFYLRSAE